LSARSAAAAPVADQAGLGGGINRGHAAQLAQTRAAIPVPDAAAVIVVIVVIVIVIVIVIVVIVIVVVVVVVVVVIVIVVIVVVVVVIVVVVVVIVVVVGIRCMDIGEADVVRDGIDVNGRQHTHGNDADQRGDTEQTGNGAGGADNPRALHRPRPGPGMAEQLQGGAG